MKKLIAIISIVLIFFPTVSFAAIAFDTSVDMSFTSGTSLTKAMTLGASATVLVVSVWQDGTEANLTGVTYNGVAMTKATTGTNPNDGRLAYLYYLFNPTTGSSKNIVISVASTAFISAVAASYSGTDTTALDITPVATQFNGTATPYSHSVTTVTDGSWVVAGAIHYAFDMTAGAGNTLRILGGINSSTAIFDTGIVSPAGSATTIVNSSATTNGAVLTQIVLKVPGAAVVARPSFSIKNFFYGIWNFMYGTVNM